MLDYLSIFRKLNERKIRYIVAGGVAVNLYGIPRMTYDIDLLLDLQDENLRRFAELVSEWGFRPKAPVDVVDLADEEKREKWIKEKNMKAFNLYNDEWAISEIDVIVDSAVSYNEASKKINKVKVGDVTIPLISIDDLIKMKEHAARPQDLIDAKYLRKIKDEERRR